MRGVAHQENPIHPRQDQSHPATGVVTYAYELRSRDVIVSTGSIRLEHVPVAACTLPLNGKLVRVHHVGWRDGEPYLALADTN